MVKILAVDDEPSMLIGLQDNLEFEGYQVETAANGEEALTKLAMHSFDLVILDIMMLKMSGLEVCKKMRADRNSTPVIFLSAKGEEIDKVLGLELGADDYIVKPFSLRELIARVKALLRRTENANRSSTSEGPVNIGRMQVNFGAFTAFVKNKPVSISHKEFELLKYLYINRNKVVSREQLLNDIWGYDEAPTTRTIDNFIVRLRQKAEEDPNHPKIILTVHGIGYKLVLI